MHLTTHLGSRLRAAAAGFWLLGSIFSTQAHAPSDTFLSFSLTQTNLSGRWEITRRDLQHALGVDQINDRAAMPAQDLRLREDALAADTFSAISLSLDGSKIPLELVDEEIASRPNGDSVVLHFRSAMLPNNPAQFALGGKSLFAVNPQLRCIVHLEFGGESRQTILTAGRPTLTFALAGPLYAWAEFWIFVKEGIWHIWTGYDHILFLLALLLPALLSWREQRWHGAIALRPVILSVLKIVTAFTVAHSLTLALAVLHIVNLPTRWVESVIAASVLIAAANNLVPLFRDRGWIVAFGFGLIHGFGFANALDEAGLPKQALAMALIGFNCGVEIGQLAIISLFVPVAYQFRNTAAYQNFVLRGGSVLVMMLAAVLMTQRILNFKWLPF